MNTLEIGKCGTIFIDSTQTVNIREFKLEMSGVVKDDKSGTSENS